MKRLNSSIVGVIAIGREKGAVSAARLTVFAGMTTVEALLRDVFAGPFAGGVAHAVEASASIATKIKFFMWGLYCFCILFLIGKRYFDRFANITIIHIVAIKTFVVNNNLLFCVEKA